MYSHQFFRKLCCDITSQLHEYQVSCVLSGKATDSSPQPTITATAYPAELDDDDALPQTLPPVSPSTPSDPLQQLRNLNVDTLRIDDTNIGQIVNTLDQQLLKASSLDTDRLHDEVRSAWTAVQHTVREPETTWRT